MGAHRLSMANVKCGSRLCWGIACGFFMIAGLVMIIAACAVGSCSCDNVCKELKNGASASCTSVFDGCEKGYDARKCSQAMTKQMLKENTKGSGTPSKCPSECDTGGMSGGAFFAVLIFGIIFMILGCVFICGCVPCCCFAGMDVPVGPAAVQGQVVVAAVPPAPAPGVSAAPPPPPGAPEK